MYLPGQGSQNEVAEAPTPILSPNVMSSQNPTVQRASATPHRTPVSSPFNGPSPYRPSPHSRGEIRSGSSSRRVLQRISSTPVRSQSRGGTVAASTPRSDVHVATPDPSGITPRGTQSCWGVRGIDRPASVAYARGKGEGIAKMAHRMMSAWSFFLLLHQARPLLVLVMRPANRSKRLSGERTSTSKTAVRDSVAFWKTLKMMILP